MAVLLLAIECPTVVGLYPFVDHRESEAPLAPQRDCIRIIPATVPQIVPGPNFLYLAFRNPFMQVPIAYRMCP